MIVITSAELPAWNNYIQGSKSWDSGSENIFRFKSETRRSLFSLSPFLSDDKIRGVSPTPVKAPRKVPRSPYKANPDAKGMANKEIHNWNDIEMICGRGRATGGGAETFNEAVEAMVNEEDPFDTYSHSVQSAKSGGLPSTSSATKDQESIKRVKKDGLVVAVQEVAQSVKQYCESKQKNEDKRPNAKLMYEVVSSVVGLTRNEVFKATQRLMNGNQQEFELLQDLPDNEKEEWIRFLLDN